MVLTSSLVSAIHYRPWKVERVAHANRYRCPGEVVEGMKVVQLVESKGTASGKPSAKVVIANCGVI